MTKQAAGKRAVGYVRVSDESQVDGHSLNAQRDEIARWCDRNGYGLIRCYADEGVSAYTDRIAKRPAFARLLAEAESRAFDIVVVHTLDRWARRMSIQATSLERLGRLGIGFASVTEQIDYSTPAGQLLLTNLGGAAQFFSAQTGVHVRKSHRHKASQGLAVGPAPFGLRRDEAGMLCAVEGEAEAVVTAFERRALGASYGRIASWLNSEGFRTRTGRRFTAHAVKDMLRCKLYVGIVACGEEEFAGKHEAIVSRELWECVQALRRRRGARQAGGATGVLQGRIGCMRCGSALHSDRQYRTGNPMYRERTASECETNGHASLAAPFDEQIGRLFGSLAIPHDWQARIAALATKRGAKHVDADALKERRRRVQDLYEDGRYTKAEYKAKLAEIDAQIRAARPEAAVRADECISVLADLPALWQDATPEERSRLIAPLIERAYVDLRTKQVCAITPAEGFEWLLREVIEQPDDSQCFLLPAEAANQPGWWTWWRRGRLNLHEHHRRSNLRTASLCCRGDELTRSVRGSAALEPARASGPPRLPWRTS